MKKNPFSMLILLILAYTSISFSKDHSSEWEIAKMEMKDSAYEDGLKMFQGNKCRALTWSNCIIQGRAEAGIKGNCKYLMDKNSDKNQHIMDQDKCLKKIGYDSSKRKSIGKSCAENAIRNCK